MPKGYALISTNESPDNQALATFLRANDYSTIIDMEDPENETVAIIAVFYKCRDAERLT